MLSSARSSTARRAKEWRWKCAPCQGSRRFSSTSRGVQRAGSVITDTSACAGRSGSTGAGSGASSGSCTHTSTPSSWVGSSGLHGAITSNARPCHGQTRRPSATCPSDQRAPRCGHWSCVAWTPCALRHSTSERPSTCTDRGFLRSAADAATTCQPPAGCVSACPSAPAIQCGSAACQSGCPAAGSTPRSCPNSHRRRPCRSSVRRIRRPQTAAPGDRAAARSTAAPGLPAGWPAAHWPPACRRPRPAPSTRRQTAGARGHRPPAATDRP